MAQLDPKIEPAVQLLREQLAAGVHHGAVMYVSLQGQEMADVAVGELSSDAILPWLSAGKPIAAVAIAQLLEKGMLALDDAVAKHVPEFARRGKEIITIRHLLTHTAGIRWAKLERGLSWDEIIQRICDAPIEPNWVVGQKAGYHQQTSWFLLGEIVRRVSGKKWEVYAKEEIFLPVGMVNSSYFKEESYSPGSGARGPARELGMFYEMMLRKGESSSGAGIISPETVEELISRHRVGMFDHTFKHVIDWGLGFIINSAQYGVDTVPYGYGRLASARTFGHGGRQCCSAFADPDIRLAAAVIFKDQPGEEAHDRRMRQVVDGIYSNLAGGRAVVD